MKPTPGVASSSGGSWNGRTNFQSPTTENHESKALRASQFTFPLSTIIELLIYFMDILVHSSHRVFMLLYSFHGPFIDIVLHHLCFIMASFVRCLFRGIRFGARKICLQLANIGIFLISLCLNLCNVLLRARSSKLVYPRRWYARSHSCLPQLSVFSNGEYPCAVIQHRIPTQFALAVRIRLARATASANAIMVGWMAYLHRRRCRDSKLFSNGITDLSLSNI